MDLGAFQQLMESTYGANDRERGVPATVAWLAEEVGELAQAVRKGTRAEQEHEFGDVLAWLASLANQVGVDLADGGRALRRRLPQVRFEPLHLPLKSVLVRILVARATRIRTKTAPRPGARRSARC